MKPAVRTMFERIGGGPFHGTRFPCVDGLRAVAAISVLLYHAAVLGHLDSGHALARGAYHLRAGVWVFFVISGFLLYRPFAAAHLAGTVPPAAGAYARRRLLRIYPAYACALMVATFGLARARVPDPKAFLIHLCLLQNYLPSAQFTGIPQAWSLSVEISFYAFLPLFAWVVRALGRRFGALRAETTALGVMAVAGLIWRGWTLRRPEGAWLPAFLPVFAIGMLFAVASAAEGRPGRAHRLAARLGAAPGWCCMAAGGCLLWVAATSDMAPGSVAGVMWLDTAYTAIAALLVVPAVFGPQERGLVRRMLRSRVATSAGLVSYGVFLWHFHILTALRPWWTAAALGGVSVGMFALIGSVLTALVATASWTGLERPLMLSTLYRGRDQGVASAAAELPVDLAQLKVD